MKEGSFNPAIEAVVAIRHLVIALSKNWSAMKKADTVINDNLNEAKKMIANYGSETTKQSWENEMSVFDENLKHLKVVMDTVISKIKEKNADGILENWNNHTQYSIIVNTQLEKLKAIGGKALPENKTLNWENLWSNIADESDNIKNEVKACELQLKLIGSYNPKEIDELTDNILKHIPVKFSKKEANKYTKEYIKAYEDLKTEASQKKNLWDKFLDILAGGSQQTPAQRVMMQRWVNGEKNDLH